jgi:hypothetical protein
MAWWKKELKLFHFGKKKRTSISFYGGGDRITFQNSILSEA